MGMRKGNSGSFMKSKCQEAWLFTEFGESYARRIFGNDVVDSLPKYTNRSKHAGRPKGKISWRKTIKGGWCSQLGAVIKKDLCFGHGIWETPWGERPILQHGVDTYDKEDSQSTLRGRI